jgi:hypothetical protein
MLILVYGADGAGKSVQCKQIAEANESPVVLSLATKNRALYKTSGVPSEEILRFNEDATVNPYKTMDTFQDSIDRIIKENLVKLVIIDEITLLRKWAQPVVLEELNKIRRSYNKPALTKIGKDNLAAWARVNEIVYGQLERLANWAAINDTTVIAITAITEERRLVVNSEGETSSEATGKYIIDAKLNVKKLADVIVRLEKDGSKGRGYFAFWDKQQEWMGEGADFVKVDKNGLLAEFLTRGIIE